jgi:hypothetical protein
MLRRLVGREYNYIYEEKFRWEVKVGAWISFVLPPHRWCTQCYYSVTGGWRWLRASCITRHHGEDRSNWKLVWMDTPDLVSLSIDHSTIIMQVRWIDACVFGLPTNGLPSHWWPLSFSTSLLGLPADSAARLVPVLFCCFLCRKVASILAHLLRFLLFALWLRKYVPGRSPQQQLITQGNNGLI